MNMKRFGTWLAATSLILGMAACDSGDDDGGDSNATTLAPTTTADPTGGGGDTDAMSGTADGTANATTPADDSAGDDMMATTDPPATCNPPCENGAQCIAGQCIGGGDTGMPVECGTNVGTGNMACDDCSHANCCMEVQACFGDETVVMATPCLELNNCIATNCTMATNAMELQTCIDTNCPDLAGELGNWLAFNNCVFTNCQAQCAGG